MGGCRRCNGEGSDGYECDGALFEKECPDCDGTGFDVERGRAVMEKCPKCGEDAYGFIDASGAGVYKCGSTDEGFDPEHPEPFVSNFCLRRQLAQSDEKRAELKAEYDLLLGQLAAANERVGELERALGVRPEVAAFAAAMEAKLKENDHKGGWSDCDKHWLMDRLYEEADELCGAVNRGVASEIEREAADVANFAMMIFDIARNALGGGK